MKRLSIRGRLTLWYTGILAATLILLGLVTYGLLMRGLWQDVDTTLDGVAKAVAQAAQPTRKTLLLSPRAWRISSRLFCSLMIMGNRIRSKTNARGSLLLRALHGRSTGRRRGAWRSPPCCRGAW